MKTRTLLVGSGKLATHFRHYFLLKEVPFQTWNRQENSLQQLNDSLTECTQVMLLISDSSIEEFINLYLKNFHGSILHCSGALVVPEAIGLHPLMTFGTETKDLSFYEAIPFISNEQHRLKDFFPLLNNPQYYLNDTVRARYHAYCVIAGNFTQLLWQASEKQFAAMGLPRAAITPYLNTIFENILQQPATGPLVRKDKLTVKRNLEALSADPLLPIYQSFVHSFYPEYFDEKHP